MEVFVVVVGPTSYCEFKLSIVKFIFKVTLTVNL